MTAPEKAPLTATPSSEGPVTDDKKLHQNADTIFVLRHSGFLRHSSFVVRALSFLVFANENFPDARLGS